MKVTVSFKGKEIAVEAQWIRGQLWYHLDGQTRIWEPPSQKRNSAQSKKDQIVAPMPGKVTKVLKKVGDSVIAGDVVLVLEAMKMEYSMKSEVSGVIESISVKSGEQTILGKVLAKVKEENP